MLRAFVLLAGIGLLVTGICVALMGPKLPALYSMGMGVLILLGTLFEGRYRNSDPPQARWESTGERFVDPQTGRVMDVQYDPESGERRYVEMPTPPASPPVGRA